MDVDLRHPGLDEPPRSRASIDVKGNGIIGPLRRQGRRGLARRRRPEATRSASSPTRPRTRHHRRPPPTRSIPHTKDSTHAMTTNALHAAHGSPPPPSAPSTSRRTTARARPRYARSAPCRSTSPTGEFVAVMGPSGSGKSTLMHLLAGLDRPTEGAVYIEGTDVTKMKDKELTMLRRERVGFVFQAFNLIPQLTAEENIVLPLTLARQKANGNLRLAARAGRPDRPRAPQADRALGRPAAARRGRSRAHHRPGRRLRRRADRQPRLARARRDPLAAAPSERRAQPDDRDGHP